LVHREKLIDFDGDFVGFFEVVFECGYFAFDVQFGSESEKFAVDFFGFFEPHFGAVCLEEKVNGKSVVEWGFCDLLASFDQ
jgi:hypothetical protein